ncbi:hypothetical protein AAY473_023612 [Plecturocebus cupreus]
MKRSQSLSICPCQTDFVGVFAIRPPNQVYPYASGQPVPAALLKRLCKATSGFNLANNTLFLSDATFSDLSVIGSHRLPLSSFCFSDINSLNLRLECGSVISGHCSLRHLGPNHSPDSVSQVAEITETGFHHLGQAGLELASSDPPISASQSGGITGISHYNPMWQVQERVDQCSGQRFDYGCQDKEKRRETGFLHIGQAGLKLLTLGDPLALASQSTGITDVLHRAQPRTVNIELQFVLEVSCCLQLILKCF